MRDLLSPRLKQYVLRQHGGRTEDSPAADGTHDKLAELHLLRSVVETLGARATLHVVDDADHSFHVRASSGLTDAEVVLELARTMSAWFFAEGEFVRVTRASAGMLVAEPGGQPAHSPSCARPLNPFAYRQRSVA
ncbi:alpha/beta family hydrolase [Caballeronia sp. GAFFF1]|uniref:alpha/beta family hydrolase n=1 Tax=Caballeronia sp. GAFFF1 TaxID=2921779 RepID=UPI0032EE3EC9